MAILNFFHYYCWNTYSELCPFIHIWENWHFPLSSWVLLRFTGPGLLGEARMILLCGLSQNALAKLRNILRDTRIPGTAEPGGLLSMESHRIGHNWSDLAAAAAAVLEWTIFPSLYETFPILTSKDPCHRTLSAVCKLGQLVILPVVLTLREHKLRKKKGKVEERKQSRKRGRENTVEKE